ncbi:MAG: hypothetical protein K0B02_03580 [DPANN group archaeon]|nr:hypothetical protein [DPANN group archaeon]
MKWKCKSCGHEKEICKTGCKSDHELKNDGTTVKCNTCNNLYVAPDHCGEQMYVAS